MWELLCHTMDLQKWSQKGSFETRLPKFLQERESMLVDARFRYDSFSRNSKANERFVSKPGDEF